MLYLDPKTLLLIGSATTWAESLTILISILLCFDPRYPTILKLDIYRRHYHWSFSFILRSVSIYDRIYQQMRAIAILTTLSKAPDDWIHWNFSKYTYSSSWVTGWGEQSSKIWRTFPFWVRFFICLFRLSFVWTLLFLS